ncbi:hypothetical protein DPSP01_010132 [Paraphaeosphaeria sporulosa]|uniref:Peptidase S54 rhomboid domain-containing protein n=1 Tax=Paraphaeosphaeria sporulosa TaxID=1460663 RepID=A0A177CYN8_9PLEO|nr:uncharacterized protein CC84DRAFT_130008 [Paraphaeosphaeria sporulosa]OAG12613.1 hypothetical protein CC84DRAFT_130008 [Paraphaeosphaeria sporulosa]
MSNAIPLALRPAARAARQWNSVTSAFARRYCVTQCSSFTPAASSPVLSAIRSPAAPRPVRSFCTTPRIAAKADDASLTHQDIIPPQQGLPQQKRTVQIGHLPTGRVSDKQIRNIFGDRVSGHAGNSVLRILHHRRTSGSLADYGVDNLGDKYNVSRDQAIKALEWLRNRFPIDEARAAEAWAEKEANRIAYELWLADPENDSKYKDPARVYREQQKKEAEEREQEAEQQERSQYGILRTGKSQFEIAIQEKRRQRLEEITKKAEEKEARAVEEEKMLATGEWVRTPGGTQLMKPGQDTYVDVFGREQVSRRKEEMEKAQKAAETPFKDPEEMLAQTTLTQRLYPMTAFVLVVCLVSFGFAHYYEPPAPSYRLWPDLAPSTATLAALLLTNTLVCLAWRWTPFWPILTRYFMHVPGYPRAVQALGNVFSHVQYEHLLGNMMVLALVAPVAHELVGRGVFLGTYVSAGALGTLASLYWANLGRGSIAAHSVGASAAIWGIATLYCLLTDTESIKIPFGGEVSFWPKMLITAFVAWEIAMAARKSPSTMDHASHFGGIATGVGVAGYLHVTGFHQRRAAADTEKTVDVGGLVKEEVSEVKDAVVKVVKKA